MDENRQKLVHLHTSGTTEPTAQMLNLGEIAVQHATEESCLYIKDNDGNLIKFIPSGTIQTMIDHVSIDCGFYGLEPEHEYADPGLPSGTLWATKNIQDADGNDLYFAWGETQGYTSGQVGTDKNFTWEDYEFGTYNNLSKYNSTDGKTVLEPEDDAATVNWGEGWRMPTKEEIEELMELPHTWDSSRSGYSFTDGNDNELLFVFAGGLAYNGYVSSLGEYGLYWSGSLSEDDDIYAWELGFDSDEYEVGNGIRHVGHAVRPVRSNN